MRCLPRLRRPGPHSRPGHPNTRRPNSACKPLEESGPWWALSLTTTLERVPFRKANAFGAFIGLDPRAHDSRPKAGHRRLSKRGPAEWRRLLFNAAMSAIQTTSWKPLDESYRTHGWITTAALVILALKIARAVGSIHHYRTTFNPARITQCLT
ncbi:MAG: hypothetical protein CCU26_04155 [Nitrospira sp. UW-LDO-01]|nr:MAG: hypothetical protein CCU26_04155 [Nitrospira sp. UW-LDO-01]